MSTQTQIPTITIVPEEHAQRLTTSIDLLRDRGACRPRFCHLLNKLGLASIDIEDAEEREELGRELVKALWKLSDAQKAAPINLLTILEHNGLEDCLWALCATAENCYKVARLMAADFAEAVLPIFERERPGDTRPRDAANMARAYALGIADAAARDDASAAARDDASAAAWAAAWAAARDAARDAQSDIIRRYLRA